MTIGGRGVRANLRMNEEFCHLNEAIGAATANAEGVDYFPSPGNWGDSLINAGADRFLRENKIPVRSLSRDQLGGAETKDRRDRLAIIGGGGGWNNNWSSTIPFVTAATKQYGHVLVMPSSYDPELISEFPRQNVTLVSRASGPSGTAADLICHDMAFYLEMPPVPRTDALKYPLICLRRDKERNQASIDPDRNWDVSLLGTAMHDHLGLLKLVDRFEHIYTDRLHVAIAGAMLGKRVVLLDGNYGKNAGVFNLSLKENYSNVQFAEWEEVDWSAVVGTSKIGVPGYAGGQNSATQ